MKSYFSYVVIAGLCCALTACNGKGTNKAERAVAGTTLEMDYATGFSVYYTEDYKQVVVHNPWEPGAVYANYYLVEDRQTLTPEDGVKIQIPLQALASTSVTHYEFLSMLDELHTVTGVCQPALAYNEYIRKGMESGALTDLGDAFNLNVEKVLQLRPSAVMMSGLNQVNAGAQRIAQAGIPVVYNNEWTEKTLLGRAEWIKFVGVFYNQEALADSLFADIEDRYNHMKALAGGVAEKPSVMAGSNFRGTWYMPAGQSFMGQLFADGGATYRYADDSSTGSLPLSVEKVLVDFADTDYWLNCNSNSLAELLKEDDKYRLFRPVKQGQVYNFNKRTLPSGANDFWESAVARPDLLLSDVIAILHPDLLPGYELFYAEKLK